VGFFLPGVIIPSISYEIEMTIDKPARKVFEAITNRDLQKQWVDGLQSCELTHGKQNATGSEYSVSVLDGETTVDFVEKIVRLELDSLFEYSIEANGMEGIVLINCTEYNETSTLLIRIEWTGSYWFTKSILPLLKKTLYYRELQSFENFKSLLEKV
jgi:uncharacterized protein YndB with AHSA1/START domain